MISDPYKIQNSDPKKNFSYRPINEVKKQNIKLKPFVTDKARIEKYIKSHLEEHEKYKKNKISITCEDYNNTPNKNNDEKRCFSENTKKLHNNNSSSNSLNMEKYLQPIMKFKPRTDLERIFDSVNLNYYGRIDRNLVNEQLKSSLLKEKLKVNPETLRYLIKEKQRLEQGPKTNEIKELISNMDNIIHINKEIISKRNQKNFSYSGEKAKNHRIKRRNMNNFLAKNILSEYQRKTHFKALCTCSLDLNNSYKKKNIDSENSKENKNLSLDKYDSINNLYNERLNIDISKNNFKYNYFNIYKKKFHNQKKYEKKQIEYLKNICNQQIIKNPFGFDSQKKIYDEENEGNTKIIRKTNLILINGKSYNKNDLKGISNALLKECNYIKQYFDVENAGEGKTMITRGMTVNAFTQKYGLPK